MIKLLSLTIVAALFTGSVEQSWHAPSCAHLSEIFGWTDWFDLDNPSGNGDFEILHALQTVYPGRICDNPVDIEVRTLSGLSLAEAGEQILRSEISGFECWNRDQPDYRCNDYKVRYSCPPTSVTDNLCWTMYFNRDRPNGEGDSETLNDLRAENPGKICDNPLYIQAITTDTMTLAINTGQTFFAFNPTEGFVCRNQDQTSGTCKDYGVRFVCPCDCT